MADYIDGAVDKIENIVKHGRLKHLKKKLKSRVLSPLTDNVPDIERKKICKKASNAANNLVSRVKKEVSDRIRRNLGLD